MNRVVGLLLSLLGIFALSTSLTSEPTPSLHGHTANTQTGLSDGQPTSVYVVAVARAQKQPRIAGAFPFSGESSNQRVVPEAGERAVPVWLAELNQWRRMAGLRLVAENANLSDGSEAHARYLVAEGPADTAGFRAYDRSIGPVAHLENPKRPSYSIAGAEAAIGGPLAANVIQGADVAWEGRTESGDIDNLVAAPFHRLSLLAPWAQIGGYGSFGQYPRRAAALALRGRLNAQQRRKPIEFPSVNTRISIRTLSGSEWPNPVASCSGYQLPVGLPITVQTGSQLALRFFSVADETSGHGIEVCGFDALGYQNTNALQRERGRELLNAYGAVVLVPRRPLLSGHQYRVVVQTSQGHFEWVFTVHDATELKALEARRPALRQVAAHDKG